MRESIWLAVLFLWCAAASCSVSADDTPFLRTHEASTRPEASVADGGKDSDVGTDGGEEHAAKPDGKPPEIVYLSDLEHHPEATNVVFSTSESLAREGKQLCVGGKEAKKGLSFQGLDGEAAYVTYWVPKGATFLKGLAAIGGPDVSNREVASAAALTFSVRGDKGERLWHSTRAIAKPGDAVPFSVKVGGKQRITLALEVKGSAGEPEVVWIDPLFEIDAERAVRLGVQRTALWEAEGREMFDALCSKNGWPTCKERGVFVDKLDAAHAEGLQANDIIVRINGKAITSDASMASAFDTLRRGKDATVVVKRLTVEDPRVWKTVTVTATPVTEAAIKEAEAAELKRQAEAILSVKLRMRSSGEIVTRGDVLAHNEKIYADIRELKAAMRPQDVESQPIVGGLLQLAAATEAFKAGRQSFQQYLEQSNRARADGSSGRLTLTRAIVRTPVKDLMYEINGEVWTAREFWEVCEKSYR